MRSTGLLSRLQSSYRSVSREWPSVRPHLRASGLLALAVLLCAIPSRTSAQSQQPPEQPQQQAPPTATAQWPGQQPGQRSDPQANQVSPGTISGQIADKSGAAIVGAHVKLTREGQPAPQETVTGGDGQFTFVGVPPGPFQLAVSSSGFAAQTFSGILHPGEIDVLPMIQLQVATAVTELRVEAPSVEIAQAQIEEQEKQRVFGVIPNFYVSYNPNAVALRPKQKFDLAWKTTIDPVTFVLIGVTAGIQQSQNTFGGYGQGAEGYAKRYGAGFADFLTSTYIGGAILPSLLKQDPRYFYKGTGSKRSRALYAMANSVICKGDNGRWQPGYSAIFGSIIAGSISNAYYPPNDRGASLVFENAAIGIGITAAANLFQEFVVKKLTPNLPKHDPADATTGTP